MNLWFNDAGLRKLSKWNEKFGWLSACCSNSSNVRAKLFHEITAQDNSPQVSWDESQLAPRLRLASSLFRICQRLERLSVENNFVNSRGYLDRLKAFAGSVPSLQIFVPQKLNWNRDLRNVFSWFDRELSAMEVDAICASRLNHINYLLTCSDWIGLNLMRSEDMEIELSRIYERAMTRVLVWSMLFDFVRCSKSSTVDRI